MLELIRGVAWHLVHVGRRALHARHVPETARPRFGAAGPGELAVTWLGHATVVLETPEEAVILDPVLARRVPPVPVLGARRFAPPPVPAGSLPPIGTVLVSHDHYDHLDLEACAAIDRGPGRGARWLAGGGSGPRLTPVVDGVVESLEPWEETRTAAGSRVTAVPTRHRSGRYFVGPEHAPTVGWVLGLGGLRVFYAGDTGYGHHFAEIDARLGPFDLSILPIGSYAPRWMMRNVHMTPEEAVRAVTEMRGTPVTVPVHYGTYPLAQEPPEEPPARLRAAWTGAGLPEDRLAPLAQGETRIVRRPGR